MIDLRKHRTLKGGRPAGQQASRPESQQAGKPAGQKAGESPRQRVDRSAGQRDGGARKVAIRHHWELEVHKLAVDVAMRVFEFSKHWPAEEKYSLTDQVRRSSRSVAANLAEGWRKRKYEAAFVSKLNDAEGEAAETQDWLMFAVRCGYLDRDAGVQLHRDCDRILAMLTKMGNHPAPWLLNRTSPKQPD